MTSADDDAVSLTIQELEALQEAAFYDLLSGENPHGYLQSALDKLEVMIERMGHTDDNNEA